MAKGFLWIVALVADITKIALDFFFGIGFILDPVLISPVTWMIFMVTFMHNSVPMFSGERAWMGWSNIIVAETPVVDGIPDWSLYMLALTVADGVRDTTQGIM